VAHLPAAVSLLLLEALFMQISGVSLKLIHRLCLLRVLLGVTATAASFLLSKHTGDGHTTPAFSGLPVYVHFMWEVGLTPLLWSFAPTTTFTNFPAPDCWACTTTLAFSGWLVRDFPSPHFSAYWPCTLCCVFLLLLIIIQFFFFFPWVGVCLSRGLC
jgi:hypothetical protein